MMKLTHQAPNIALEALEQMTHQQRGMVKIAHRMGYALVIATSVASLIALAGESVNAIASQVAKGHFPGFAQIASIAITLLLVLAMDVGMILAAVTIRTLSERKAAQNAIRPHMAVVFIVGALEAGTYLMLLLEYEQPHNVASVVLIGARALAVPALSIYLSMAQPQGVSASDILTMAALGSGEGMLRDIVAAANQADRPLGDKAALFHAASDLTDATAEKLARIIRVTGGEVTAATLDQPKRSRQLAAVSEQQVRNLLLTAPDVTQAQAVRLLSGRVAESAVRLHYRFIRAEVRNV